MQEVINECWKNESSIKNIIEIYNKNNNLLSTFHGNVLYGILNKLVSDCRNDNIKLLDVGCGTGIASLLISKFDNIEYTGLDNEFIIERVSKKLHPELNYIINEITEKTDMFFLRDYDVVLMNAFIDVLKNPMVILEKILKQDVKYIIIHRQEFSNKKTVITVNKSYGAETYHSIINFNDFNTMIHKYNYDILNIRTLNFDNWNDGGHSIILKQQQEM